MTHATVKIGEYTIPLIGVAEDATKERCDKCLKYFHLSLIGYDGRFLCQPCRDSLSLAQIGAPVPRCHE